MPWQASRERKVAALSQVVPRSGLAETFERGRWVMDTNHRIGGKFTDARVERMLKTCGSRASTELIAGFRTTFAVPEEFKP